MLKIKICGITNLSDALLACKLGSHFLGFIFYPRSPRYISPEEAKKIIQRIPKSIKKVGVFVNEKLSVVKKISKKLNLDFLQFHGNETPSYILKFKDYKIIKAFRIKDEKSLKIIPKYDVDFYLLDTYVKRKIGGTGEVFNWDLVSQVKKFGKPIILSGGLNSQNIIRAIRKTTPYAVDVSSGVEKIPGKKDSKLVAEFIRKANYAAKLYCSF